MESPGFYPTLLSLSLSLQNTFLFPFFDIHFAFSFSLLSGFLRLNFVYLGMHVVSFVFGLLYSIKSSKEALVKSYTIFFFREMFRLHVKAYVKTRDYVQKHNVKVAMEVRQENV